MATHVWHKSKFRGVRYREHATRTVTIGSIRYPDRYYSIRYQSAGQRVEEGLGWWSDPVEKWTEEKAFTKLFALKEAAKSCKPDVPTRLSEERERNAEQKAEAQRERERVQAERKQKALENVTADRFFYDTYWPTVPTSRKHGSQIHDESHFKLWLAPVIGQKPIRDISPLDLERIKKRMLDAKKAPRTIQYVFATFRQIWNMAKSHKIVDAESPSKSVKLPKFDNTRTRFLSPQEAANLLDYLKAHGDVVAMQMTALSLFTGMRADEIFNLRWRDIDQEGGTILVRKPKNHESRYAFINEPVADILGTMKAGKPDELLFSVTKGKRAGLAYKEVPDGFGRAVEALKLNEGVTERNDKVVFHSCRHSFTSWLVVDTPLLTVSKLTGHKTLAMAKRYAHLTDRHLRETANKLQTVTPSRPAGENSNVVQLPGTVKAA